MKSIDYLLQGYDIYHGNPYREEGKKDPGFRSPIFKAYYSGKYTADKRFQKPDGIEITSCAGDCLMTFESSTIDGANKYRSRLDLKVT